MKNIFARGGIEFLAVLLGISSSLWIDNNNKQAEEDSKRNQVYVMLENQVDELLQYSNSKLSQYDTQLARFQNLVDNWSSFDLKNAPDKNDYIKDIWFSISNAYYPDFSIYETLINNGDINLVDFEVILKFGRLYRSMDDINTVQEKEREWRDFIENHLMQNYSDLFSTYGLPFGLFDFFAASKDDQVIYAHLKSILSVQGARRSRVQALRDNMKDIQAQLVELKERDL